MSCKSTDNTNGGLAHREIEKFSREPTDRVGVGLWVVE